MTDAEAIEPGRIVAAWEHFRWLPGMRDLGGNVYLGRRANAPDGVHQWCAFDRGGWEWHVDEFGLPDIRDRATQALVMQLIEEQVGRRHVYLAPVEWGDVDDNDASGYQWVVVVAGKAALSTGTTRAEAIAAAVRELSRGDG